MPVYPIVSGHPDYSSGSASAFIPAVWSGKLIEKLYPRTVFSEIANTDYEGEISAQGDKVMIRTTPTITINDHEMGQTLTYENPTSDHVELLIDKGKYFAFNVDNVLKHQSDLKLMDNWSDDAGEQMKVAIDKSVLADIYSDVAATNAGPTAGADSASYDLGEVDAPLVITKDNVLDVIADFGTVLDEANVPDDQRWVVLPSWVTNLLKKSDLRDAGITGDDTSPIRNGKIGVLDNMTVYKSNNVSKVEDATAGKPASNIIFGHKKSLTWASQMTKMDTMPDPARFGELVRGLNVYGYKVIDPNAMGHCYAVKG